MSEVEILTAQEIAEAKRLAAESNLKRHWKSNRRLLEVARTFVPRAIAAIEARDALLRNCRKALTINPFSGGRDGDLCLWCGRDRPRDSETFEDDFKEQNHSSDCELILLLARLRGTP
jgi:hypothetical protein